MKWTILLVSALLGLGACSPDQGTRSLAAGEKLRVMATTVHLASLAMAIGGDEVDVGTLAPEGRNPHDYEPTVSDRRRLSESHLLLVNGLGLENFDAAGVARAARATLVDCSAELPPAFLITDPDDDHDHGPANPHVWLSAEGAVLQAKAVARAMGVADPAHAELYDGRMNDLKRRLEALRAEYAPKIALLANTAFAANHDAFPYFAREFGMTQVGVLQRRPGEAPSMADRRKLEETLKQTGARAIFIEPGFSDKASRAIAERLGIKLATLDPLAIGKPTPRRLEETLRANLKTVLDTLAD